ncbi:MAG: hypothetical protein WC494_02185 [Candidatus Pacearchaeota archaeon]
MNNYTPEGLPILTIETIEMHYLEEQRLDREREEGLMKVMEDQADEIFGENPFLEVALERFTQEYGLHGDEKLCVQAAGVYVYQLLKRQAEINGLERLR